MKHILTTTILLAAAFAVQADDKSIGEKARDAAATVVEKTKEAAHDTKDAIVDAAHHAERATRSVWRESKAYLSDDMPVYREGAHAKLTDLSGEIADVKSQTPANTPLYFRTRLLALEQQHEQLEKYLAQLSPEQIKDRSSGARYDFDQCVGDLERAIDQAKDGTGALLKIAQK